MAYIIRFRLLPNIKSADIIDQKMCTTILYGNKDQLAR